MINTKYFFWHQLNFLLKWMLEVQNMLFLALQASLALALSSCREMKYFSHIKKMKLILKGNKMVDCVSHLLKKDFFCSRNVYHLFKIKFLLPIQRDGDKWLIIINRVFQAQFPRLVLRRPAPPLSVLWVASMLVSYPTR